MAREMKRININVPIDTLARIDKFADSMSINRTSAVLVLCSQALDSKQALSDLEKLVDMMKSEQEKEMVAAE